MSGVHCADVRRGRLPCCTLRTGSGRWRARPPGTLVVHEIYRSLQGESTFAGLPCVFIRLTACHLRCVYCDTPHAFNQGEALSLDEVVARRARPGRRPRRDHRRRAPAPARGLSAHDPAGRRGQDGAARDQRRGRHRPVDPRVRVILDLKTPGSGEVEANVWSNLDRLKPTDEVKFVLCDRADFDWSVSVVRDASPDRPLPGPLQPRLRPGQPDRAGRLDPRDPPADPPPAPAAQDPLGPQARGV